VPMEALSSLGFGEGVLTPSRTNGFLNMVEALRTRARRLADPVAVEFPSLRISAGGLEPRGAFAEAQARFLEPDAARVDALVKVRLALPRAAGALLAWLVLCEAASYLCSSWGL